MPAERSEIERIAFALVLATQVEDQAGEEDPEGVEDDLGHVDVAGDCACGHCMTSARNVG